MISMMADPAKIIFAGQLGTGLAAKIANNYIAFCTSLATAEAMSIGVRSGVEPKTLFDIIRASTGDSWHLGIKPCIPDIVPTAPSSNGYAPAFKPFMVVKDLGLALEAARETGIEPRCATAALETYKKASQLTRYKVRALISLAYSTYLMKITGPRLYSRLASHQRKGPTKSGNTVEPRV